MLYRSVFMKLFCLKFNGVFWLLVVIFCVSLYSCSVEKRTAVRNFPEGKPFVYDNQVAVTGNVESKSDREQMALNLPNFWADSLSSGRFRRYGFFYKIPNPPVFDTSQIAPTIASMNGYMNSLGYYQSHFTDTFYVDSARKNQLRTHIKISVLPNKPTLIDSLSYSLEDSNMNRIALKNQDKSLIKPGVTKFSSDPISAELDRLVTLYRNDGYLKLNKTHLIAEMDTMDLSMLQLTLNPFDQAVKMAKAVSRKQEHPTVKMAVKLRPVTDTTQAASFQLARKQFVIGQQYFYPEMRMTDIPDSVMKKSTYFSHKFSTKNGNISIFDNEQKFVPRTILDHFYLHHDSLYNDISYYRTINNLNQIGAWQEVDGRAVTTSDSTVDLYYFMVPAVKQNVTVDLEASRNTGDYISNVNFGTSSNSWLGLALNVTYRNRNAWRRAIQSTTTLSNGVELNLGKDNVTNQVLQTLQSSLTQTYVFPRFITPFKIRDKTPDGIKSILSINGSYQDRREYFKLGSVVANWGYEWRAKNKIWQYRPLNVELYYLDTLRLLKSALDSNPYIRNAFNTGTIVSQQLSMTMTYADKNIPRAMNYVRIGVEESGAIFGRIKSLQDKIYQYLKFEAEYRKQISFYNNTQLAFRAKMGIGFDYGKNDRYGRTLPFYKQFVAGGPNSMRAWSLRQLGLGSSLVSDTSSTFRDRYGDMQLEANVEYRYPIFAIGSAVKVNGAVFTDAGNIWNVRANPDLPNAEFKLSRLGKDLAIGVGTGIRFDFNYFLLRLDLGIKLKDPARLENGGWLDVSKFTWKNNEFPKVNPISGIPISRNNYALQLGINLPF